MTRPPALFREASLHALLILAAFSLLLLCVACSTWKVSAVEPYPHHEDGTFVDENGRLIITQFGISWYCDREYEFGRFANGDYWVIGPVTLVRITPDSRELSGRTRHGAMVNPSPVLGNRQGFDSTCFATVYTPGLNAALNVSSLRPLVLHNDSSLVSCISIEEPGSRPQLQTAAVLTVLETAPADGSFRPPYSGTDKSIDYNVGQLNFSLLGNLDPVADTPALAEVERYFERPWIDHMPGWSCGSIHPLDNVPDYGREIAAEVGTGALMLHLRYHENDDDNNNVKRTLFVRYVQLGIDLYGIVRDGGLENWHNDGGHASGRKWPILFAGLVLGDAGMTGIGARSGDYLYDTGFGPGNPPPDYIHFGEDDQTFYVTDEDVALGSAVSVNPNQCEGTFNGHFYAPDCRDYPEYTDDDLGMPEWGIRHSTSPLADGNTWDASYRDCCTAISWAGFVLAARIMNAQDLWNHDALFDYQDRYMAVTATPDMNPAWRDAAGDFIRGAWGTHPGWRPGGFVGTMWDTYR